MPLTAEYDPEADALYVRLSAGACERAVEIDETTYVDVDAGGHPVGIEILYPSMGISLGPVLGRFSLHQQEPAILAAIADLGLAIPIPTYTGGNHIANSFGMTVAIEGTVAASYGAPLSVAFACGEPDAFIQIPA